MDLRDKIRNIPDFPIKGVLFRDITTLLKDAEGYHELVDTIANSLRDRQVDLVVGIVLDKHSEISALSQKIIEVLALLYDLIYRVFQLCLPR